MTTTKRTYQMIIIAEEAEAIVEEGHYSAIAISSKCSHTGEVFHHSRLRLRRRLIGWSDIDREHTVAGFIHRGGINEDGDKVVSQKFDDSGTFRGVFILRCSRLAR